MQSNAFTQLSRDVYVGTHKHIYIKILGPFLLKMYFHKDLFKI